MVFPAENFYITSQFSSIVEREIAKYSYVMVAALVVSVLFNYFYHVFMGILLPKREFGILGVALSIFYIASVLTQNTFSWSGTRRMASARMEDVPRIFRTTVAGNLTLALLASLIILYYSYSSATYLIPNTLVVAALLLSALANSYVSFLRAMKKFTQIAGANVISSFLRLFFAVVLVMAGLGAVGAVAGLLISITVIVMYLSYHAAKIRLQPSKGFVRDMISETFFVSVIFLGITFIINSSIIFMRWFSGSDVLAGDYNAALTIARGPFFVTSALITVLFPYISSNSNSRREDYAFQAIKYTMLFVFPLCISMAVDPETWLNLFFSKKYMGGSEVLRLLSIGIGFTSLAFMVSSNLVAFEKPKVAAASLLAASIMQVVMVLVLIGDPVTISASSVAISSMIAAIVLVTYYRSRFYFKASTKYVLKILIAYSAFSASFLAFNLNGRLLSLVEIAVSFSIYFLILSILRLFDENDVEIIFSPLPSHSVEGVKRIVARLNGIGR
jgi:O-antigen/teichoic acid export membrane protein